MASKTESIKSENEIMPQKIRVRSDLYPPLRKGIRVRRDLYPPLQKGIRVRRDLYPQYDQIRVRKDLYPQINKEPGKENDLPLKKRIRARSDKEKTLPFKKRTHVRNQFAYSVKQNVKKKAYLPQHDEKLHKMIPRVVLKKLNIVKIPLLPRKKMK